VFSPMWRGYVSSRTNQPAVNPIKEADAVMRAQKIRGPHSTAVKIWSVVCTGETNPCSERSGPHRSAECGLV